MRSNIALILNMFKEGNITEEEAEQLIVALNHNSTSTPYIIPWSVPCFKPEIDPFYETTSTNRIEVNQK